MKSGIDNMTTESVALKIKSASLEKYLAKRSATLSSALASLSLSTMEKAATVVNIEQ